MALRAACRDVQVSTRVGRKVSLKTAKKVALGAVALLMGASLLAMGAVALVAAYSVHARFPRFGKDAVRQAPFFFEPGAAKWR